MSVHDYNYITKEKEIILNDIRKKCLERKLEDLTKYNNAKYTYRRKFN